MRDENQLHAAVVELIALDGANIKCSIGQRTPFGMYTKEPSENTALLSAAK